MVASSKLLKAIFSDSNAIALPNLWRISQYIDLKGEGGRLRSNRWNIAGRPVVYLGESVAGVVLEYIVHFMELDSSRLPERLSLIQVEYPDAVQSDETSETRLPGDWRTNVKVTRSVGDNWLQQCKTVLLKVPSAVVPYTANFLLNPEHPDAHLVKIGEHFEFRLDLRLRVLADFALSYRSEIRFVAPDE